MDHSQIIRLKSENKLDEIVALAEQSEPTKITNIHIVLSIAEVYLLLKVYEKSIQWYERALDLGSEEDIFTPLSELYRVTQKDYNKWNNLYQMAMKASLSHNQLQMIHYEMLMQGGTSDQELLDVLSSYVEEELFELHLIEYAELFIKLDNKKEAKKILRKVLRFSTQEECLVHTEKLIDFINNNEDLSQIKIESIRSIIYKTLDSNTSSLNKEVPLADDKTSEVYTSEDKIDKISKNVDSLLSQVDNMENVNTIHASVKIDNDKIDNKKSKETNKNMDNKSKENKLMDLFNKKTKPKKSKKKIIRTIEMLFTEVVGMEKVKDELQSFYDVLQYQNQLKNLGVGQDILLKNFIITGERGSGKSLVAGILASMLEMFGLIDNDSVMEVHSRDIQEAYSKEGSKGLLELFSELTDMVIVIDHIDRLFDEKEEQNSNYIALAEGMADLMKARKDSLVFVLSGKKSAMNQFVNDDIKNLMYSQIDITSYTMDELVGITCTLAEKKGFMVSKHAYKALMKRIQIERCTGEFNNAITLEGVIQQAIRRKAERQRELSSTENLLQFEKEDFDVDDDSDESMEELLQKLDGLTGLASVKNEVRSKIENIIVQQNAVELGAKRLDGFGTLHMIFKGGPGTGKTTVARIIGKIYQKLGVLPKGNVFVECSRKDLVGEYQGHTAKKTHDKVLEALGGVLFIDEAYSLVQGENDGFGLEALTTLVADIENYRDSIMVILAGYSEDMDTLIAKNPGLASRFPNEIVFEDYTLDELTSIFGYIVKEKGLVLDRNTQEAVYNLIKDKSGKRDFGNARGVRNLVDKVKSALDRRLVQLQSQGEILSKNDYDIIRVEDIESLIKEESLKEKTVEELIEDLNNMTGLGSVKKKVREMVALITRKKISEEFNMNSNFGTLHLVFLGNAGTGKTTVARLIGQIYEKLGVLKNGDVFVECSRASLIGQYQGQTTKKVEEKVKEAEGGILFIDEAYDLCHSSGNDSYGIEIVSTLLKAIEDKRDNLMVIMAGYKDKMDEFFNTNQGLKSRMSTEVYFEDYTIEELSSIFYYMAKSDSLRIEEGLEETIQNIIQDKVEKQRDFGNARGVRNIYEDVLRKQALRLFDQTKESITKEQLTTLSREDFM